MFEPLLQSSHTPAQHRDLHPPRHLQPHPETGLRDQWRESGPGGRAQEAGHLVRRGGDYVVYPVYISICGVQVARIRRSCQIARSVLSRLSQRIEPGVTTDQLGECVA